MKTQYYTATSLDGFIATEDDSLEWLFSLADLGESSYPAFIAEVGALAMGAATYEWMVRNADKVVAETGAPFSSRTEPSNLASTSVPLAKFRSSLRQGLPSHVVEILHYNFKDRP